MALTTKALRIFSAVEALREGHADVRYALLPLFRPDLSKFHGEIFDASKVSKEVNSQYHLNVTADVIEGFIPLFLDKGWVAKIVQGESVAFRVDCPPDEDALSASAEFEQKASELAAEFRQFVSKLSPLSAFNREDGELVEDLVNWLISLDVYSEDELKTVRKVQTIGKKLVYETVTVEEQRASDENYLSARFIDHLVANESPFVPFLIELASVGLITDVVRDFQKPTVGIKATNLIVYLDAPVALDYLGLSGKSTQQNISAILNKITSMGGSLRVYRVSVEEMQNSLNAMLSRPLSDRDGATAQALRNREVLEALVREVASNPDGILKSSGIAIVDQDENQFPNEHKYFTKGDIHELYSRVHWVQDDVPKYHDALVAGLTLRKRAGARSNDLFELRHVVVTRNPYFEPVARRITREKSYIGPTHFGPVVHQRQLATAVWLRAGLAASDTDIPRKYILSACRRVLAVHRKVIERVKYETRNFSDEAKEQLELLLAQGRSTQVLMDKTLGSASVIDSTNVERLVEAMRKSLASEAFAEADEKVRTAREEAKATRHELTGKLRKAGNETAALREELERQSEMHRGAIDSIVSRVNRKIRKRRVVFAIASFSLLLIFEALPYTLGLLEGEWALVGTLILYALTIVAHFTGAIRVALLDPVLRRLDEKTLQEELSGVGMSGSPLLSDISYSAGAFRLEEHAANDEQQA